MKRNLLIISLFLIAQTSFSQKKIEWVDIDQILNETIEYEKSEEYEEAIREISKIPKDDSVYYSTLTSKTYYFIQNKNYEEAIKIADEGLKSKYQNFHHYFIQNKIAGIIGLKDYDNALKTIDKALITYPKSYRLYSNKGLCYEGLNKYQEAAKMYKKSITFNPFYKKNHLRLAILSYNEELITQTMMCLNMYLLCSPDGPNSFNVLNSFNNMVKSKNENKKHKGVKISKDDESFEEIDLIINNYAALNKKYKTGNKISIPIVKQNHAMIDQLGNYEGNGGFWDKNYVQFFK